MEWTAAVLALTAFALGNFLAWRQARWTVTEAQAIAEVAMERAEKAEKERDEARALLKEARGCVHAESMMGGANWRRPAEGTLARIDAALEAFGFALGPCRTLDMAGTDLVSQVLAARERHIPIVPRAVMLAELMRMKQGVAIAGTHGKTTTTSLVASVLAEAGLSSIRRAMTSLPLASCSSPDAL